MSQPQGFVIDDDLAYEPLEELGWHVEAVAWEQPGVDWNAYEVVVIRSPWNYQLQPHAFLETLAEIDRSSARLENQLPLVRWNLQKTYLRDLAQQGVAIVPTVWKERLQPGTISPLFGELSTDQMVIKPVVGAGAEGAYWLTKESLPGLAAEVEEYYSDQPFMAQPFVRSVIEEGEFSLFYFNGKHSHTILKSPKPADFRVQEEHGGIIRLVEAENNLIQAGAHVMNSLGESPLYARVDLVRSADHTTFWLMELEVIEPALYLRMDPAAPTRFAHALDTRMRLQGHSH